MNDLRDKCVYVCGKVTGNPNAAEAFRCASAMLREYGADIVVNPCEKYGYLGKREAIMSCCIQKLMRCDALVALPNWRDSEGARLEVAVAKACGIPCYGLTAAIEVLRDDVGE